MLTKIILVIATCANMSVEKVQDRLQEIKAANPGAEVSYRVDTKARCYKGQVLTGKDAKLFDKLGEK